MGASQKSPKIFIARISPVARAAQPGTRHAPGPMEAGSSAATCAGAPPPPAAAAAGAGAAPPVDSKTALPVDPYEARVARLIATLPPEEVSADLRTMHDVFTLLRSGFARLGDLAAGVPELAQGAVDLLRGAALADAVVGASGIKLSMHGFDRLLGMLAAHGVTSATRALGDGRGVAPELALLESLVLVSDSYRLADGAVRLPPDGVCAMGREVLGAADFWAAPGRAEATAARLAALGVERGGGAAADALFALATAAANCEADAHGEVSVRTLERAAAAIPLGLFAASNLANVLMDKDARMADQVALRAGGRAPSSTPMPPGSRSWACTCSLWPRTHCGMGPSAWRSALARSGRSWRARGGGSRRRRATCRARTGCGSTRSCKPTRLQTHGLAKYPDDGVLRLSTNPGRDDGPRSGASRVPVRAATRSSWRRCCAAGAAPSTARPSARRRTGRSTRPRARRRRGAAADGALAHVSSRSN
jgi:hypothetical protein